MTVTQCYKGARIRSTCELQTETKTFPAGTEFIVIDVIYRHKSNMIKGHIFPGRIQMKLANAKIDPWKKQTNKPFNVLEEKANENLPFVICT